MGRRVRFRHPKTASAPSGGDGFLLLEVMVALLLSAIVVVPLATCLQRAAQQAQTLTVDFGGLQGLDGKGPTDGNVGGWGWGPATRGVTWRPGPELDVWVGGAYSSDVEIGIWADGWLLGAWEAESGGRPTTVGVPWSSFMGSELCIRAREASGGWGPPWRCVVPDEYGDAVASPAGIDVDGSGSMEPDAHALVLHTKSYSTPSIHTSWAATGLLDNAAGLVFFLPESSPGHCEVTVGGERQSWHMEWDRGLDVYF
jgi:hypothetical protein